VRASFRVKRQLADDWKQFLLARSTEMHDGAKLVSLFMGRTTDNHGEDWFLGECQGCPDAAW
jgi:hypothetical protein